jgi:hypothetical protein
MRVSGRSTKGRKFPPGTMPRGQAVAGSRLTEAKVREIRDACAGGEPQTAVASRFEVGQMTVSDIVRRKTWAHVK